jgi:hypothetical protein
MKSINYLHNLTRRKMLNAIAVGGISTQSTAVFAKYLVEHGAIQAANPSKFENKNNLVTKQFVLSF